MSMRSTRARSVSRYSATATRSYPFAGSSENIVGSVRGESVAVRVPKQFLISAYLLIAWKSCPRGNVGLARHCRRHNAVFFIGRLRHRSTIAQQKGPGKTGAFDHSKAR